MSRVASSEQTDRAAEKLLLERSHLHFTANFFREREGQRFNVGPHHGVIARALDDVFEGRSKRLLINVPPGFTKTESAVIAFMARGFARNPAARFIHATYDLKLALDNSAKTRDTIRLDGFRRHWRVETRDDTDAKSLWRTTKGGGLLAASSGGGITGFRAGQMTPGFSGALIIDDPLKPDDAKSDVERGKVNARYMNTFRSRLAHEDVPIIVIMQRLDMDDMSGFLLGGGGGEPFDHLWLPAHIRPGRPYPVEWTHGRPIEHNLPAGPLWPEKMSEGALDLIKRADPSVYAAQYDQEPVAETGELFKAEWLRPYETMPNRDTLRIYGASDYAVTDNGGDYTVHVVVGMDPAGDLWLLDLWRGQTDPSVWVDQFCDMVRKWRPVEWAEETGQIRSGIGPFREQRMRERNAFVAMKQFPTRGDKVVRATSIRGRMALRGLYCPANEPWFADLRSELLRFPAGAHDDQVDALGLVGQLLDTMTPGRDASEPTRPRPRAVRGGWMAA